MRFPRHPSCIRRGFTLLEALMASGILLMVVVAVTSAITAGQQHAFEAQQRVSASIAAEELIGRLSATDYYSLPSYHNYVENVGVMLDMDGHPMPQMFDAVGRRVSVQTHLRDLPDVGVKVRGREVRVQAFDRTGRVLADVVTFVPEPAEDSVPS